MLHTYQAEINGSQLIWIDQPPATLERRRVLVVVEDVQSLAAETTNDRLQAFNAARGCMGHATREQVLAELARLRDDWTRDPLDGVESR